MPEDSPSLNSTCLRQAHLPNAASINAKILEEYTKAKQAQTVRQTHHFHGRVENTYIDRTLVPALGSVIDFALDQARQILQREDLKFGFWFNEMAPGHVTSLHSHEEEDELLSAVYYITAPADSGRLVLHLDEGIDHIQPQAGLMVLFPPQLPHEVEKNLSPDVRLSVAMNFGPLDEEID